MLIINNTTFLSSSRLFPKSTPPLPLPGLQRFRQQEGAMHRFRRVSDLLLSADGMRTDVPCTADADHRSGSQQSLVKPPVCEPWLCELMTTVPQTRHLSNIG